MAEAIVLASIGVPETAEPSPRLNALLYLGEISDRAGMAGEACTAGSTRMNEAIQPPCSIVTEDEWRQRLEFVMT
jgi:hypothetical protein